MPNLNKVMLMGNLTRNPELRVTPKGTAVCQFGLAVNRRWKDDHDKDMEEVTFIDITAWGKTGEVIAKYFTKGRPIFVEGRLKFDQWEDKQSGQNRSKLSVMLERFEFLGGRDGGDGSQSDAPDDTDQTRTHRAPPPRAPGGGRPAPAPQHDIDDSDVPF